MPERPSRLPKAYTCTIMGSGLQAGRCALAPLSEPCYKVTRLVRGALRGLSIGAVARGTFRVQGGVCHA